MYRCTIYGIYHDDFTLIEGQRKIGTAEGTTTEEMWEQVDEIIAEKGGGEYEDYNIIIHA